MPVAAITVGIISFAVQLINSCITNANNEKMRKKREEYALARQYRQQERMFQIMRESHDLMLELEQKKHRERMDELHKNLQELFKVAANEYAMDNWPLNILPIVMKYQTIGKLFNNESGITTLQPLPIHCILTKSNYTEFNNDNVFQSIERELERHFNYNYGVGSQHNVIFYSGAWRTNDAPTHPQLRLIHDKFAKLPVLVVTPYFNADGNLTFQIRFCNNQGEQNLMTVEPHQFNYTSANYFVETEDVRKDNPNDISIDQVVGDIVPYLECLVGCLTDTYYLMENGTQPLMPALLKHGVISTEGRKYLVNVCRTYFDEILTTHLDDDNFFLSDRLLQICKCCAKLINDGNTLQSIKNYFESKSADIQTVKNIIKEYTNNKNANAMEEIIDLPEGEFGIDPTQYSQKRDELLSIMDKVLEIEELSEAKRAEFQLIRKKCLENQFNITLVGEFQGGKSTTFNAFCGGREISPRGAMIKTSACPITATNISDPDKEEFALIRWKTDSELIAGMEEIIAGYQSKIESTEHLSLSSDIAKIKDALLWENENLRLLQENQSAESNSFLERLDIYRIADIVAHFYGCQEINDFKNANTIDIAGKKYTICTIEDVAHIAVFPQQWEARAGNASNFNASEVFFAFIGSIECYIHSKNLERLGCSVTDCPGLFASRWDTDVAVRTIAKSDAVLYLLSGSRALSVGDKRALTEVKSIKPNSDEIFFAMNTRGNSFFTDNIRQENIAALRNLGFNNDIYLVNSQLFFLAEFGNAYLNGSIDDYSKTRFKDMANKMQGNMMDLEDAWVETALDSINAIGKRREIHVDTLSNENVIAISAISNKDDVFSKIEKRIIDQKAYSILISNGANKVRAGLKEMQANLQKEEEDANQSVEQCEAEYQEAQAALDKFQTEAKEIIDKAFPQFILDNITIRAYEKIRDNSILERMAIKFAIRLYKAIDFDMAQLAVRYRAFNRDNIRQRLENRISPILTNVINENISVEINKWGNLLFTGNDADFNNEVSPRLNSLKQDVISKWNQCQRINNLELESIAIDISDLPDFQGIDNSFVDVIIDKPLSNAIGDQLYDKITKTILLLTAAIIGDIALTGGLIVILSSLIYIIASWLDGKEKPSEETAKRINLNKTEQNIYDQILPQFITILNKPNLKKEICKILETVPKIFISKYTDRYYDVLAKQRKSFEKNVEKSRRRKQGSLEQQLKAAAHANRIRIEKIEPMITQLNTFVESCRKK